MSRRRALAVVAAGLLAAGCGGSGAAERTGTAAITRPAPARQAGIDPALAKELQHTLDQQRAFFGLPGAAAAVVVPGAGMWAGGSGAADRRAGTPVAADTPFAIASLTKMFVGVLAARLQAERRLRLDDTLSRWLPRWPHAERITLRQLLSHMSGVSAFAESLGAPLNRAIDRSRRALWTPQRVLRYAGRPQSRPGTEWSYNNAGYLLAGMAIERATGARADRLLRSELLGPLGIRDAALQPQQRLPGAAHGYGRMRGDRRERDLSDGTGVVPFRSLASASWTAGGMVASAPAVARFADAALRGSLLTAAARRELLEFVPADNAPYIRYGLGIGEAYAERVAANVWAVFGATAGFGGTLVHHPARHITVVVLANRDGATRYTSELAALLLEQAAARPR